MNELASALSFGVDGFSGIEFGEPGAFYLLLLLPLLVLPSLRSLTGLSGLQVALSALLRALFLAALAFGLAHPRSVELSERVCAVALVDVSESMSNAALARARTRVEQLLASKAEGDEVALVAFAEHAVEVPLRAGPDGKVTVPPFEESFERAGRKGTNVERAVKTARAFVRSGCVPRLLVLSDGIETVGDGASAMLEAHLRGVSVSTEGLLEEPPADAAVTSVIVPPGVRVGEPFRVSVELTATRKVSGTLQLFQGELLNGLGGSRKVEFGPGPLVEVFDSVVRARGEVAYRAEFTPSGGPDHFPDNDRVTSTVDVPGPPRVLIVDRQPGSAAHLGRALSAQQFDVDLRPAVAFPRSRSELAEFSFVVLSDVPRAEFSPGSERLLEAYVKAGGGLLVAGGEAGFGPGGWQGSALEKILPVRAQSEDEREIPGVALALVIDRSGSMTGLPLQMAKEACQATLSVLAGSDLLEVIAFDAEPTRLVRLSPARLRAQITASLMRLTSGGGTELFSSLDMAYQDLAAIEARKKHIVLLTDGNAGSDGLFELAETALAEGITVTTVGLGGGVNRELLSTIAEQGGGRFHLAEDPSSLPRIFTRETELVSKESAVEDWFPVTVVKTPEFLSGISLASAPYLRGYTRTELGPPPSELVLASDTGRPILGRRKVGLGWTLAWTSDLKARWGVDWLRWAQFGKFIAQLVRAHQHQDDTLVRPMRVRLEGTTLVAEVDAFDQYDRFDTTLESRLVVSGGGGSSPLVVPFEQELPGRYEARLELPGLGAYSLVATHERPTDGGEKVPAGVSYGAVSLPYADEYKDLAPRPAVLSAWAEAGGGKVGPSARELMAHGAERVASVRDRQAPSLLLALALFLLDLLVRRVRIFDRDFASTARLTTDFARKKS